MPATLEDVRLLHFPRFDHPNGSLVAFEAERSVPFPIRRVFVISATGGAERGHHAHRRCFQFLVCVAGVCRVTYRDERRELSATLSGPDHGLLLPPGVWSEQYYQEPGATVMVFCDQPYDEREYIRSFPEFLDFRAAGPTR